MPRFLKLTNAYGVSAGQPVAVNIDQIVSITPYKVTENKDHAVRYTNANCMVTTTLPEEHFIVQETFEKITDSLPN